MEVLRTCLSCRKKAIKPQLCRFVRAQDGEICFDEKGDLPNRGAWVCANKLCLMKAFSKRLLFKGERTLPVDQESLLFSIQNRLKRGALSRLGLMRKLGQIEMGKDAVCRLAFDKVRAVIFAQDFSLKTKQEIKNKFLNFEQIFVMESNFLMEEIGQSLGRKKTGVVALLESRITDEILLQINKLKEVEQ